MLSFLTDPREYLLPRVRHYFAPKPLNRYAQVANAFETLLNTMRSVDTQLSLLDRRSVQLAVRDYRTLVFDAGVRSGHTSLIRTHAKRGDVVIVQSSMLRYVEESFAGLPITVIADDNLDSLKPLLHSEPLATIWCDGIPALDVHNNVTSINQRIVILNSHGATIDFALKDQAVTSAEISQLESQIAYLMNNLDLDLRLDFQAFVRSNPSLSISDATKYFLHKQTTAKGF